MHSHDSDSFLSDPTFDTISLDSKGLDKYYCVCGRIVTLDSRSTAIKKGLGKPVECPRCRNRRIAREMEDLERHFLGIDDEDDW